MMRPIFVQQKRTAFWQSNLLVIIIFMMGFFADISGAWITVSNHLLRATAPAQFLVSGLKIKTATALAMFRDSFHATVRIQELEQRYAEALAQLGTIERLTAENRELREALNIVGSEVLAPVARAQLLYAVKPRLIARDEEKQQISAGHAVSVSGVLIGTTGNRIEAQTEFIPLNWSEAPPVVAKTSSGTIGLVVGTGRGIELREVLKDAPIAVGDRVVSVSRQTDGFVPPDLLLGVVVYVDETMTGGTKRAVLDQPVIWQQVRFVEVW